MPRNEATHLLNPLQSRHIYLHLMLRHLNHNTGGKVVGKRKTWSGIKIDFYENFLTWLWGFWMAMAHF